MDSKLRVLMFETPVEEQSKSMGLSSEKNEEQFPMGLLYLDAILKKKGYEVLTKDYTLWSDERALAFIRMDIEKFKPDFVGITVMTMTRASTYKTIKLIKKINPKIKLILGGIHSSVMYEQLLKNFPIDAICIGEAEETFPELLDSLNKNKSLKSIKGIAYEHKGRIIVTKRRKLRRGLDSLPYPNYDAFMKPEIKKVQILSSRGCPYKCNFCCLYLTSRQIWRPRDPKKVVDEIEFILKKYPWVDTIQFLDDTFTLNNKRVIEICKDIIKRGLKAKFYGQARIKPISREMVYWMEKAGFTSIYFGIETGSEKLMASMHKGTTKQDCVETFKIFREFPKIKIEKFIIVGLPGETNETVRETIGFIKQLQKLMINKMEFFYAAPLWVFPGTEVYQMSVQKGKMNDNYWLTDRPVPFFTAEHSEKWLLKMSNKIVIETMISIGLVYFLRKAAQKLMVSPWHYIRRFLRISQSKNLENIDSSIPTNLSWNQKSYHNKHKLGF